MSPKKIALTNVIVAATALVTFSGTCIAATLTVGSQSISSGVTAPAEVPISLSNGPGENVAGMQFDIRFDADTFTLSNVVAGPAVTAAAKDVSFSRYAPGQVRVIIAGFNENMIPDGMIVSATFTVASSPSGGEYPVSLSNVLLSDLDANEVPSEAVAGSIFVAASSPDGINGWRRIMPAVAAFIAVALWVRRSRNVRAAAARR